DFCLMPTDRCLLVDNEILALRTAFPRVRIFPVDSIDIDLPVILLICTNSGSSEVPHVWPGLEYRRGESRLVSKIPNSLSTFRQWQRRPEEFRKIFDQNGRALYEKRE
ncbi:MAG: hypothetical protein KJ042_03680, partial [Deltaproteobacteria bacterium]|nr:hypothetical protein [Deltaproteobacteria bacterium]